MNHKTIHTVGNEDSWRAAGLQSVLESPKVGSNTDGGMPQQQDGCTCQPGKGTQAQDSFFFPCPFIWGMPSEGAARCRWVFLLQIM